MVGLNNKVKKGESKVKVRLSRGIQFRIRENIVTCATSELVIVDSIV